jgi:hypothetical protein
MGGNQGGGPRSGLSTEQSMDRVRFIEHRGVRILQVSFAGVESTDEIRAVVEAAGVLVRTQPPGSVLTLINVEGVPYTFQNVGLVRRALDENRPYVRARAVCGLTGIGQLSFTAMSRFSQRPMEQFEDSTAAKDWLVEAAR